MNKPKSLSYLRYERVSRYFQFELFNKTVHAIDFMDGMKLTVGLVLSEQHLALSLVFLQLTFLKAQSKCNNMKSVMRINCLTAKL